jgi:hypothetical protein
MYRDSTRIYAGDRRNEQIGMGATIWRMSRAELSRSFSLDRIYGEIGEFRDGELVAPCRAGAQWSVDREVAYG